MNRSRIIFVSIFLTANAIWCQRGGIGMGSIITADDITIRQATCEIISTINLSAALILMALIPKKQTND